MLLTSLFTPSSPVRPGALAASLWQGEAPPGLSIQRWHYLGEPREKMLLIWTVADESERAWLEARMSPYGDLQTWVTADSTPGMAAAMARDFDAFGQFLRALDYSEEEIAAAFDVRQRGAAASSIEEAAAAAAEWAAAQSAQA
ncbi:MAG: hypothetical protein JF603_02660 [Acidobacteria bacterium]|nr:hypothetical protein [Acidobacteriota bacterium]